MTIKEFNELKKKHYMVDCETEDVINFVYELLINEAKELEKLEPYAIVTIDCIYKAAHEVDNLLYYIEVIEEDGQ